MVKQIATRRDLKLLMESSAGRRDQKSRQSGRSRLSRAASGVVQSVPPSTTADRTGPQTPQRMSVQPPVSAEWFSPPV